MNKKIDQLTLILVACGLLAFVYISLSNDEDPTKIIYFEEIQGLNDETIENKDKLYTLKDDRLLFHTDKKDVPYEALFELNDEIFGTSSVLFKGSADDLNQFVTELIFVNNRVQKPTEMKLSNMVNGASDNLDEIVSLIQQVLQHPFETAYQMLKALPYIGRAAWDLIKGEYTKEDLTKLVDAYLYNEYAVLASRKNLDYEKCYLEKTRTELEEATKEYLVTKYGFGLASALLTGLATKAVQLKNVKKPLGPQALLASFDHTRPVLRSDRYTKQAPDEIKEFQSRLDTQANKSRRTRTTHAERRVYESISVGTVQTMIVDGFKIPVRQKQNINPLKKDAYGKNNCERMEKGKPPIANDGTPIELHHHKQQNVWTGEHNPTKYLVEMSKKEHAIDFSKLHRQGRDCISAEERKVHNQKRAAYWKAREKTLCHPISK